MLFAAIIFLAVGFAGAFSPDASPTPALHLALTEIEAPMGPVIRLRNRDILTVDKSSARISEDEGKTWTSFPIFPAGAVFAIRNEKALLQTDQGTVILAFSNDAERSWNWNREKSDSEEVRLPNYVTRSLDGGRTWEVPVKLHDEWTGAIRDVIQTKAGTVIFSSMMMLHNPGRHATVTYSSQDDGLTWHRSNLIDLGGRGHHDGALEAALVERKDGAIWMLMRTNFGKFWEAISYDEGHSWRTLRPTAIDASSAPALVQRTKDGRLIMIWNRLLPEGETEFPTTGGDGQWSETPAINHRGELSIAFSEDDGKTWSQPEVIARAPEGKGSDISCPFLFAVNPGEYWLSTMRGGLSVQFFGKDFLRE